MPAAASAAATASQCNTSHPSVATTGTLWLAEGGHPKPLPGTLKPCTACVHHLCLSSCAYAVYGQRMWCSSSNLVTQASQHSKPDTVTSNAMGPIECTASRTSVAEQYVRSSSSRNQLATIIQVVCSHSLHVNSQQLGRAPSSSCS